MRYVERWQNFGYHSVLYVSPVAEQPMSTAASSDTSHSNTPKCSAHADKEFFLGFSAAPSATVETLLDFTSCCPSRGPGPSSIFMVFIMSNMGTILLPPQHTGISRGSTYLAKSGGYPVTWPNRLNVRACNQNMMYINDGETGRSSNSSYSTWYQNNFVLCPFVYEKLYYTPHRSSKPRERVNYKSFQSFRIVIGENLNE